MQIMKPVWLLLLLAVILSLASCASSGPVVRPPASPVTPQLPQRLLKKTDYVGPVRQELYEPSNSLSPSETKSSTDTKPSEQPR